MTHINRGARMGWRAVLAALAAVALAVAGLQVLAGPAEAAFPEKNGAIVFSGRGEGAAADGIYRMKADGTGVRKIAGGYLVGAPDFSADGRKLVWDEDACGYCYTLHVANADGTGKRALDPSLVNGIYPAWYPSGRKIVFSSDRNGREESFDLYVVSLDRNGNAAGAPTKMTQDGDFHYDLDAAVSPDGSKIVFSSNRGGGDSGFFADSEIYVMDADRPQGPDNPLVQLTDNTVEDSSPDFSPDGRRIVYETFRNGNSEVVVMNADGSGKKNLTHNPADDREPAFSPDGRMIVFTRDVGDERSQVWKMRADGTGQVRLTGNAIQGYAPDWQPLP